MTFWILFGKINLHVLFSYILIIKSIMNLNQNSKWNRNNFVLQNMLTETIGSSWYHYETHFVLSNCGSLENWFSINYIFVITCLYLYIFIFRYTYDDLRLKFCRFSFFSLLLLEINFQYSSCLRYITCKINFLASGLVQFDYMV